MHKTAILGAQEDKGHRRQGQFQAEGDERCENCTKLDRAFALQDTVPTTAKARNESRNLMAFYVL